MIPVWFVSYFVSQDGAAHLYNAYLINQLIDRSPEFSAYLTINSFAVPNSTGHWLLVVLLRFLAPFTALKVLATVTFAAFTGSIDGPVENSLERRAVGDRGLVGYSSGLQLDVVLRLL